MSASAAACSPQVETSLNFAATSKLPQMLHELSVASDDEIVERKSSRDGKIEGELFQGNVKNAGANAMDVRGRSHCTRGRAAIAGEAAFAFRELRVGSGRISSCSHPSNMHVE